MGKPLYSASSAKKATATKVAPPADKATPKVSPAPAVAKKTASKLAATAVESKRAPGRPKKDVVEMAPKRGRGRPSKDVKTTPTQRVAMTDKKLVDAGGRILNKVRLSPEAATKLESLKAIYGTDRAAIENALLALAK